MLPLLLALASPSLPADVAAPAAATTVVQSADVVQTAGAEVGFVDRFLPFGLASDADQRIKDAQCLSCITYPIFGALWYPLVAIKDPKMAINSDVIISWIVPAIVGGAICAPVGAWVATNASLMAYDRALKGTTIAADPMLPPAASHDDTTQVVMAY